MTRRLLSKFGRDFSQGAGVIELMDDLGTALSTNPDMLMMGGGNPGHIPEVAALFRERMADIMSQPGAFDALVGSYGPPQGPLDFRISLAGLLRREFGWQIDESNVAITNGSQSASFMLFNLLAGPDGDGGSRHVCLPLAPEYIGYADQGLGPDFFRSTRPAIERLDGPLYKYRVDFDAVKISPQTAAICTSRPTNPTGNVLTDDELQQLSDMARNAGIPLIIDGAYGLPFPGIVFTSAQPLWDEHIILCLSLSKLGLPGARTGIIVATPEIVNAISGINAIVNLTTGGLGPALAQSMVDSGDILRIGRDVVRPFYKARAERAVHQLSELLEGYKLRIHRPEGAIFLWLWFEDLPIDSAQLYERLKQRGVLVLSGHHFFPGLKGDWPHTNQCIRVNCSQAPDAVDRGIALIADEVKRVYDGL